MNLTLRIDEQLLQKARAYARARNTTLNQMIRDFLEQITSRTDPHEAADEFARVAREHAGRSEDGLRFDRDAIHSRLSGL